MAEMTTEDRVKDLERRMHTLEDAYDNLPAREKLPDDDEPPKDRDKKKP